MALTTTTGFFATRPFTIVAVRSIALASSTEVPPNFITIIEGNRVPERSARLPPAVAGASCPRQRHGVARKRDRSASPQVPLGLQQLRIQQRRPGCAADRIVRKHRELPIQHLAGAQPPYRGRHPCSAIHVKPRLRTIVSLQV